MSLEDDRLELLRLGENLAAARLELTFRRWGVESKFRPDQARVPAGNGIESGRFAKEIRNAIRGAKPAAKPILRAAAKLAPGAASLVTPAPEALPALGAAALGPIAATVATSRAAGLASVVAAGGASHIGGMGMTPILGIPYRLDTAATARDYDHSAAERIRINEECDDLRRTDEAQCEIDSAMNGRKKGWYTREAIYAVCMQQARLRFEQCKSEGGPEHVTIPTFSGRRVK